MSAPGKIDPTLGEFWVETPWEIFQQGHNLSCYERKRVYLNVPGKVHGRDFLEISHLTGADNDSDGRSVVAGDFRNNGQQIVREMYPVNSYRSQMPNIVHFGLGDSTKVEALKIQWPSGLVQVLKDLPADQHLVVEEGNPKPETVVPGQLIGP